MNSRSMRAHMDFPIQVAGQIIGIFFICSVFKPTQDKTKLLSKDKQPAHVGICVSFHCVVRLTTSQNADKSI